MDKISESPVIPSRTSLKPSTLAHHRRRSLPSNSANEPVRRSSNRVNVQPASPEVISSLISSLSTISTESHFDSLPTIGFAQTAPSSPNSQATDKTGHADRRGPSLSPSRKGFGLHRRSKRNMKEANDNELLHPEDAELQPVAIPPVVRIGPGTSTPPPGSPRSPRFPRKKKSGESFMTAREEPDEIRQPGLLSPSVSTISLTSIGNSGKKVARKSQKLVKKNSIELLKNQEKRRRSGVNSVSSGHGLGIMSEEGASDTRMDLPEEPSENGTDKPSNTESPRIDEDKNGTSPNPSISALSPETESKRSSTGTGTGRFIPTRESSLRHSFSGSPSSKKRRPDRQGRHSASSSRDIRIEDSLPEDAAEPDAVTKRIEELKAQKKLRESGTDQMDDPKLKNKSPLSNAPVLSPRKSSNNPRQISSVTVEEALTNVRAKRDDRIEEIEDSAPAPAVARLNRTSTGPLTTKAGNIQTPQRSSAEPQIETPTRRSSSRLKRYSRPVSPQSEKHRRSFSHQLSPVGRQSTGVDERPSSADSVDEAVNAYLDSPRLTQRIAHPQTGRVIAFSEVGDPAGFAVFCCVGMGLTRYLTAFYDELAWTLKLRLITPDRPGVGESEPFQDGSGTPLGWADDVTSICNYLKITKFSMLAHSAGAIYALATALRMPQHMRGRLHLLAPWIPPSQMTGPGAHKEPLPAGAVPYSQRILRALPTPFLKAANSSFMSATSASITSALPRSPRKSKRKSTGAVPGPRNETPGPKDSAGRRSSSFYPSRVGEITPAAAEGSKSPATPGATSGIDAGTMLASSNEKNFDRERQSDYDNRLTHAIWDYATTDANPAVDLLVCLERRQPIGFRYVDITRAVVIHHGTRDTRVPVENVKWLGKTMRRCEVRILEGEGHGLMASAAVMGNILMEIAKEWEDWSTVTGKRVEGSLRKKTNAKEVGYA